MGIIIFLIIVGIMILMFKALAHQDNSHVHVQRELAAKYAPSEPEKSDDDLIAEAQRLIRLIEVKTQADIVGDTLTSEQVNKGTYQGKLPERRDDGGWLSIYDNLRILKIAGINHRKGIAQYVGRTDCALMPEPQNEFDPQAIKVVAEDGHHLGYIPTDMTDFVRSMTAGEFPYRCIAFIDEKQDEVDEHKFFVGFVYIKRLD